MLINSNYGFYYNQLSIQQKQEVNNICNSLGVSVQELEFYFSFIQMSMGNISFFAFVFLLRQKPHLINTFRAQYAAMTGGQVSGGYNYSPVSPSSSGGGSKSCCNPREIGDAFLTNFSQKDLQALQNGKSLDLNNGIISNIQNLSQFDKNGDGKLSGDELQALQVAIDQNKDGKIDQNEVKSAKDANVKEVDLNNGKVITNEGKTFDLNQDNVKVGNENKNAVIIDSNQNKTVDKDSDGKVVPGNFNQFGKSNDNKSPDNNSNSGSGGSNTSSNASGSASGSSSSGSASGSSSSGAASGSGSSGGGSGSSGSSSGGGK